MGWTELQQLCDVEIEADSESPETASFTNESSRAVLLLKITPSAGAMTTVNLLGPILNILGYSQYNSSLTTRMNRVLPLQHPMFGWMFATEIGGVQGRGPRAGVPAADRHIAAGTPGWQAYQHYRFAVVFTSVKYAVKRNDPAQQSELYRFVERHHQLGLENIARPGNAFRWMAGTPYAGSPVHQSFVARAPKGVVTYVWKNVTRYGLFGQRGTDWPRNISNGIGKVNEFEFDGALPGQLLMLQPKVVPLCTPFSIGASGPIPTSIGRGTAELNIGYDIEFSFEYIDPPKAPANLFNYDVAPLWKRQGHHLFPPPPGVARHYWYPATQDGTAAGDTLYQPYDFRKLFKLMGAND